MIENNYYHIVIIDYLDIEIYKLQILSETNSLISEKQINRISKLFIKFFLYFISTILLYLLLDLLFLTMTAKSFSNLVPYRVRLSKYCFK